MAAEEATSELAAALMLVTGEPVVTSVISVLNNKRTQRLNRYQVAVAAGEPVTEVAHVLEKLVDSGVITATGDVASPNSRGYTLKG